MKSACEEMMDAVRLQALQRFLEVHHAPGDDSKVTAFKDWVLQCSTHCQAFSELSEVVARLAEDPQVLNQALEQLLIDYTLSTTRH